MQLPKLTPLQSRLLASVVATCMLIVVWITFQPHHFVYAAELPLAPEDVEHSQLGQAIPPDHDALGLERDTQENGGVGYTGDFAYFDKHLLGRQTEGVDSLTNNEKKDMEANPGTTKFFMLEKSQLKLRDASPLELRSTENVSERDVEEDLEVDGVEGNTSPIRKRQTGSQVFISVNTCKQPVPDTPIMIDDPPQLKLYISTSTNNQKPGPESTNDLATAPIPFVNGSAQFRLQTDSDVYIGVEAPSLTQGWEGSFSFEVAVSTDEYFHSYMRSDPFMYLIDIDSESGLFITHNLTTDANNSEDVEAWLKVEDIPFTMFAFPNTVWGAKGLEASFCGLKSSWSTNSSNITIDRTMTDRYSYNPGREPQYHLPKAQMHIQNLQRNTTYIGMLVMDGGVSTQGLDVSNNLTVGAGGRVWQPFQFTTKAGKSSIF
jgi:calcium channel MID1